MTLLERLNKEDRFAKSIGAKLTEIREGYSRAELTVTETHLNGANVCQGGVLFTLADLAFAAIANSHHILSLGISNTIHYSSPANLGDHLVAECNEVINHKRLPYCNITISNQKGEIIASMTGLAYRLRKEYSYDNLM